MWATLTAIAIAYVMRYAARIEKVTSSKYPSVDNLGTNTEELTGRRAGVLLLLGAGMVLLVWGVTKWDWYIVEIAGLFLAIAFGAAVIGGVGPNEAARQLCSGARDMVVPALLIGLSKSVLLLMQEGRISTQSCTQPAKASAVCPQHFPFRQCSPCSLASIFSCRAAVGKLP